MTKFLQRARAWVLDVEGCLMRTKTAGGSGGSAMPGAAELVSRLKTAGHTVLVCTNASQHPPETYAAHLRGQGIDVADDEFVTAGRAAADYVAVHHPRPRVLAVGETGLTEPMRQLGIDLADPSEDGPADVVVVGAADSYTTAQLNAACLAVDAGAALYSTVDVPWFHGGAAKSVAVSAAIAHAVGWVTGTRPQVVGKPSPVLAETLVRKLGERAGGAVVVGDAVAEVRLARAMATRAVLVLSGAITADESATLPSDDQPDLVLDDVAELSRLLSPSILQQQGAPQ